MPRLVRRRSRPLRTSRAWDERSLGGVLIRILMDDVQTRDSSG